ncbi:MAG: hypothetical protein CM1200mP25_4110 [Acidobacteriota bacterium]|nr:MAG: hypothetical protein CM1200mP25_4110 [Acidobacteriota bacterium]
MNLNGFPYIDHDVGGSALGLRDNIAEILGMIDGPDEGDPRSRPNCDEGRASVLS